jgi:hypothetical protein
LVWLKNRTTGGSSYEHSFIDSERGVDQWLTSNSTGAQVGISSWNISFNANGWGLNVNNSYANNSSSDYASWTFRKAPKFFDVVTYTGNGVSGRQISHNLGTKPGFIIVKRTDTGNDPFNGWRTAHIEGSTLTALDLNTTSDASTTPWILWSDSSTTTSAYAAAQQTSTYFTVGSSASVNGSGGTFVAYLFAHNDGDGDFGPTGDQDIIKCGSYTGNGSTSGPSINLGFEPQWVLLKNASASGNNWILVDNMRGIGASGPTVDDDYDLNPNLSNSESPNNIMTLTPTGFDITSSASRYNGNGNTMIYIAIRRGPMAVPTAATDVFAVVDNDNGNQTQPLFRTGFVTDMTIEKQTSGGSGYIFSRLTGQAYMNPDASSAEGTGSSISWDYMDGMGESASGNWYAWNWQRRPNYFDVVAYTGTGSARTVSHNLGVAPEMIWVKSRSNVENWQVGHKDLTGTWNRILYLNLTSAESASNAVWWNNTAPTNEVFSVGTQDMNNGSGLTYIAYLFASLDGVSKVGSFTAGSTDTFVDCGFSSSARFVLMKRSSGTGDWFVYDSERGYVAGLGDKRLKLNTTDAETTNNNIDPTAGGFTVTGNTIDAGTYIFYAIA